MGKRVSHSVLDPYLSPLVPPLYRLLPIPKRFPPEGIVVTGHLIAICGAFGFAYSTQLPWAGLAAAACVAGSHLADMVDGTHARTTGQCRNGGELLDHFTDPLSFSYWATGLAVSCELLGLGIAAVLCIYATAVLVSIKAKLIGEFSLARFGPTEFKTILVVYGLSIAAVSYGLFGADPELPRRVALGFLAFMVTVGVIQLIVNLVNSIRQVNAEGTPPDTSAWQLGDDDPQPADQATSSEPQE